MTNKISKIIATECAIAFAFAVITLAFAMNYGEIVKPLAAMLVSARILVGLANIASKNIRLLAKQHKAVAAANA